MNGCRYSGKWRNGKPDGQGGKNYHNGDIYQGQWQAGRRHDRDKATEVDGRIFQEIWRHGVLTSRVPLPVGRKTVVMAAEKVR